jgi:hypothetical protein
VKPTGRNPHRLDKRADLARRPPRKLVGARARRGRTTKESGQTSGYGQTAVGQTDKDAKTVRTLTGCLQQGDDANEFVLTAKDGSRWELRSESVKMAPHVGHTVTITGTAGCAHAKAHEMKEEVKEK